MATAPAAAASPHQNGHGGSSHHDPVQSAWRPDPGGHPGGGPNRSDGGSPAARQTIAAPAAHADPAAAFFQPDRWHNSPHDGWHQAPASHWRSQDHQDGRSSGGTVSAQTFMPSGAATPQPVNSGSGNPGSGNSGPGSGHSGSGRSGRAPWHSGSAGSERPAPGRSGSSPGHTKSTSGSSSSAGAAQPAAPAAPGHSNPQPQPQTQPSVPAPAPPSPVPSPPPAPPVQPAPPAAGLRPGAPALRASGLFAPLNAGAARIIVTAAPSPIPAGYFGTGSLNRAPAAPAAAGPAPARTGTTPAGAPTVPGAFGEPMVLAQGAWQGLSLRAATDLRIPIGLFVGAGVFLLVQVLIDRRDPKVSAAPERGTDETIGFQ